MLSLLLCFYCFRTSKRKSSSGWEPLPMQRRELMSCRRRNIRYGSWVTFFSKLVMWLVPWLQLESVLQRAPPAGLYTAHEKQRRVRFWWLAHCFKMQLPTYHVIHCSTIRLFLHHTYHSLKFTIKVNSILIKNKQKRIQLMSFECRLDYLSIIKKKQACTE